jgi:RES domain-containing protein
VAGDVAAIAVRGLWLKHTYLGSAALPEREPAPDNRWQRGDVVDALYLAESEATVWAEWYRHLAERMVPPLAQMPRELWSWQVEVEVADLSTPERLWREGWAGLLAPSAARPAGQILCLFRGEDGVRGAEPLAPPLRVAEPPPPPLRLQT